MLSVWLPVVISTSIWSPVQPNELLNPQKDNFRSMASQDLYIKQQAKPYSEECHIRKSSGEISFSLRCAEGK